MVKKNLKKDIYLHKKDKKLLTMWDRCNIYIHIYIYILYIDIDIIYRYIDIDIDIYM